MPIEEHGGPGEERLSEHIGVKVPERLCERLEEEALNRSSPGSRVTKSDLIRAALRDFLEDTISSTSSPPPMRPSEAFEDVDGADDG